MFLIVGVAITKLFSILLSNQGTKEGKRKEALRSGFTLLLCITSENNIPLW